MERTAPPLVLTKFSVPIARPQIVPRTQLVEQMETATGINLILVCAPAGYGKTTLLTEWAHSPLRDDVAVAWYALDSGDDDPITFRSYLIASFINALGPIPELIQIAQLLRSSPEIDWLQILPSVINAIFSSRRHTVLILDDYHLIGSPEIHNAVVYLLKHIPENLRIAIGSRSDPPLNLARLRAGGQLQEIRTSHLRFTKDEAAQFLNEIMRLEISPQGITTLDERTEGWIAGLQLAALSLSGRSDKESFIGSFAGGNRYLVDYLMEEVVDRQPENVKSFLLYTSILERMCFPLCDFILSNTSYSEAIIKQLEEINLFVVALDDQCHWYRYHHLFRDFLYSRLNKTQPLRIPELHRAASEWLAAHDFLHEAARHAFQTQDWAYAASFVEQHGYTLIIHSEISTLYEWCSVFPEEIIQEHPMLCILQGLALAYGLRQPNRARVEMRLQQADRIIHTLDDTRVSSEATEFISVVRTFMAFAPDPAVDPEELLTSAQRMLEDNSQGDASQFAGLLMTGYASMTLQDAQAAHEAFESAREIALRERLFFGIVDSTFHLACLAHSQGQLQRVIDLCLQGQADISTYLPHPGQELPALGSLDIKLGCILMERNHLDDAEQHLQKGLDLMGGGMNPYYLMIANIALFRLYRIQGRTEEALKYLDRLEITWPDVAFCTKGLRMMHLLRTEPASPRLLAEATSWCDRFSSSIANFTDTFRPGMGPLGAAEVYYLAYLEWVRVKIAAGQGHSTRLTLERQLNRASAHNLTQRVIELSLLEALVSQSEGDLERALTGLNHALVLAQPEGYIRIFDQGSGLNQLLSKAAQRGICKEYIERILTSISKQGDIYQKQESSLIGEALLSFGERLSERELEVLRLMAQGAPNQVIAEQLVITIGTVKSHINHILGKLESHNRTEAVARARGLGIL